MRWLASAIILLLLGLDAALPYTPIGRRGKESRERGDIEGVVGNLGGYLPDLAFVDVDDGLPVRLSDYRGQRVLLTFERSVDW